MLPDYNMANFNFLSQKYRLFATLLPIFVFFGATYNLQLIHDKYYPPASTVEDLKYLPSGTFLKGAALSYDEIIADLLWIKAIGYLGTHAKTDGDFQWLSHILDTVTTLDPYFQDPYEFGGIILANEVGDLNKSTDLLKKGMANVPKHHKRYWYLPFFTAFNYMYHKQDYQTAARYLEIAASFPQRPAYLPLLVSRLYANTDDPGVAIPFLQEMLDQASTPEEREQIIIRIKEIQIKQHLLILNRAIEAFTTQKGHSPQTLDELVFAKIINRIPEEPFGGRYIFSDSGRTVKSSSDIDGLEVHTPGQKKAEPFMLREK